MRLLLGSLALASLSLACDPRRVCVENVDCEAPLVCVFDSAEDKRFCETPCAADLACPAGQACVERDDGSFEGACLAVTEHREVGEGCVDDRECDSAACGGDGETKLCLEPCEFDVGCSDPEERCILDGLRRVCAPPLDDRAPLEACEDPRECASGTCVERPDVELTQCLDNCVVPEDCPVAGDTCVRVTGGARVCLPPLPDGSTCQSSTACAGDPSIEDPAARERTALCLDDGERGFICATACNDAEDNCGAGFVCADACARNCGTPQAEQVRACVPLLDDLDAGASCTSARECLSGNCATFQNIEGGGDVTICADACSEQEPCTDATLFFCYPRDPDDPSKGGLCGPEPD